MIWLLLGLHAAVIVVLAGLGDRPGRAVFAIGAVPCAVTAVWAATILGSDRVPEATVTWVAGLDLTLGFSVDALSAVMTLIVSGIGALVFVYAGAYFSADASGLGRFAATLLAFSAAMVGLVWSDTVWALFGFWELTSITSFLLIGFKSTDPTALRSARRAMLITVAGGLALLAGLVVIVDAAGTVHFSDLGPIGGTAGTVAAVLVMAGAATKSAQVPFHVWLPGAMVAPTPVSAYLHSATMVKAGVLLVAITAPALDEVAVWSVLGLTFGLGSMIWGAVGALRHVDAKLVLAWGTVSQLGLMIALFSLGEGKATFAAVSVLVAHSVFKAALFMVVGEVDVRTGTRDLTELSGLWRSMPLAFAVAVVSAASMAGVPPVLGFAAKEAAVEGVIGLEGVELVVVGGLVIGGSVLTVAYTVRLIYGMFGPGPAPTEVRPRRPAMAIAAGVLGLASLAGFVALSGIADEVREAAVTIDDKAAAYTLLRWPGLTDAFVVSAIIVALGTLLGLVLCRRLTAATVPRPLGADAADGLVDETVRVSRRVAATVQHGSLPVYLTTMVAVVGLAATPFLWSIDTDALYRWDSAIQATLAVIVVGAAFGAARVDSRLGAALGLGAVGVGVSGLFIAQGDPDLALTQLLVETVVVVGFVLALGHLTRRFPPTGRTWRIARLGAAAVVGTAVAAALASSASDPTGQPPLAELSEQAVDDGGGNNLVNVILTDVRGLDTLGEITVLVVVAVGILALARAGRTRAAT